MGQPGGFYLERTSIMMYAIQNMGLRSNHACSGSLREKKRRICVLDIVLVKNPCSFTIRELLVVYL